MIRTSGGMADGENWAEPSATAVRKRSVIGSIAFHSATTFLAEGNAQ